VNRRPDPFDALAAVILAAAIGLGIWAAAIRPDITQVPLPRSGQPAPTLPVHQPVVMVNR
jgi:hypothetical protein